MILNFIFCLIFTYFGAYIGRLISFLEKDERMPNFKKIITFGVLSRGGKLQFQAKTPLF